MIINYSSNFNLQSKKFDYVRVAYILKKLNRPASANTINYYFNQIFPQNYCNSLRISAVIRAKPHLFKISQTPPDKSRQTRTYQFKGEIILAKSTKRNWENRSKKLL